MDEVEKIIQSEFKKFVYGECVDTLTECCARHLKDSTGHLLNSFHAEQVSDDKYWVGSNVEHAKYVNYGRGEVRPVNKKALYWYGLPHPVKRAEAFEGYHFLEEAVARLGGN